MPPALELPYEYSMKKLCENFEEIICIYYVFRIMACKNILRYVGQHVIVTQVEWTLTMS